MSTPRPPEYRCANCDHAEGDHFVVCQVCPDGEDWCCHRGNRLSFSGLVLCEECDHERADHAPFCEGECECPRYIAGRVVFPGPDQLPLFAEAKS